ncbi:glycine--tRNA ligase subunit beta [Desertibacillus haloalkaliphilus]|uniref:glycine--tRNA ligase subunit beta n=1 Tax=Desertibacillus haloalkaliphilus TaxID=1328930 RepID=UPI001C267DA6|nr:glycine--tRNA ligase subunit beta [Desertibacillus haloalkaliphilus]MBU8905675.1 glycine--tRNA ligase subunit beta [Desertibacillus haloalkaliphilus]
MSKRDFLLEIGLEEMPARFVTDAMNQLATTLAQWLKAERISYERVTSFSTPRRLAVIVEGLAEKQADMEEEARGPAKKIAVDDNGDWTKAALGFARGQGVDPTDLYFSEVKGTEYVFAKKYTVGQVTSSLLPQVEGLIKGMNFPKNMRWNQYDLKFVRPVKWLVALYGSEVVPFEITNVVTNHYTYGHRFLGGECKIESPQEYKDALRSEFVIVDPDERKEAIRNQIATIEKENQWVIPIDEELLEEVNNLVEYPTALHGSYDEEFLSLPKEVLITSMREHQRYFPVKNNDGELLANFVTVRNGDSNHLENVVKGNEKVLRARLADAMFFYKEDQKLKLDDALSQLENIVYHEELGSIGDKVRRIREATSDLVTLLGIDEQTAKRADRAAQLCKFDLVTLMVDEFTELQGRMGEEYALMAGEHESVAKAISEHYMPRFSGDQSPSTQVGTVVSIADKLDTITTCFAIGLIPTGSQDPYALRRQSAGVIQMILDHNLSVSVEELIDVSLQVVEQRQLLKRDRKDIMADLIDFFKLRIKHTLQDRGIRYDVIEALLTTSIDRVDVIVKKAELIMENREEVSFKEVVESLSRVTNIAKKAEGKQQAVEPRLFDHTEEKELFRVVNEVEEVVERALREGDVERAYKAIASLKTPINKYFDHIMVMAEDNKVKENRLSQMRQLATTIHTFAHFNSLVFA